MSCFFREKSCKTKSYASKEVPENNLVSRLSNAIKGNNHPSISGIKPTQISNEENDQSPDLDINDQKFFKYSIGGVEWNISVSMSELENSSLYSIEYLDKDSENSNSKVKNIRILINSSHKLIIDNCNNAPEAINVTQILLLAIVAQLATRCHHLHSCLLLHCICIASANGVLV